MKEFSLFEVILTMVAIGLVTFCSVKIYDFSNYGSRISNLEIDVRHLEEIEIGISQ